MQQKDFEGIQDILLENNHEDLADNLEQVKPEYLTAIAAMVANMKENNADHSNIVTHVVHDVSGLLYKKNDPFFSPRCERFLERVPYGLLDAE